MPVAQTSISAHNHIKPHKPKQWAKVLKCLREYGPLSSIAVARHTGLARCAATGRLNELVASGAARDIETRKNPMTGVKSKVYTATGKPHVPTTKLPRYKQAQINALEEVRGKLIGKYNRGPLRFSEAIEIINRTIAEAGSTN